MTETIPSLLNKYQKWIVLASFSVFLIVGLLIYRDYGFTGDTSHQKLIGEYSFNYIFQGDPTLFSSVDKEYGSAFELLITLGYTAFHLTTDYQIYYFRNLVIFLSFFLGSIFFYQLLVHRFKNHWIGLLGSLFLILSPRIFDSAFVNSKDIPFMAFSILSVYTLFKMDEKFRVWIAAVHGCVSGFLIAIRPVGVFIVAFTLVIWLIRVVMEVKKDNHRYPYFGLILAVYLISTVAFMILWWPWLWPDPIGNFLYSFSSFAQYTQWHGVVNYIGKEYLPTELPWHYTLVWILITTPLLYSFLAIIGMGFVVYRLLKGRLDLRIADLRFDLVILGWFVLPLVTVAVLHSVLNSGWRHMFFIYPAMLFLALHGYLFLVQNFKKVFLGKWPTRIFNLSVVLSLVGTSVIMIINHPYESMYFTILAGKNLKSARYRYGLDFYGLCAKEALDYVLEHDGSSRIAILPSISVVQRSAFLLPSDQRARIVWVPDYSSADYFVGAYEDQRENFNPPDNYFLAYAVKRGGADLCVVFRNGDEK